MEEFYDILNKTVDYLKSGKEFAYKDVISYIYKTAKEELGRSDLEEMICDPIIHVLNAHKIIQTFHDDELKPQTIQLINPKIIKEEKFRYITVNYIKEFKNILKTGRIW